MRLLLTGKYLRWSLFLILSIVKWKRIHVGMDEMYEITQQAKYSFLWVS